MTLSETFLRRVLWLDAATCAVFSLLLLKGGIPLESLLGLPRAVHLIALAILVPAAALMAFCAARRPLFVPGVWLVIAGNAVWVLASLWLALSGIVALTGLGVAFLLVQGAGVVGLTALEVTGLKRAQGVPEPA